MHFGFSIEGNDHRSAQLFIGFVHVYYWPHPLVVCHILSSRDKNVRNNALPDLDYVMFKNIGKSRWAECAYG